MANKVVALFVEGPTEIEFYKAVVIKARELMGTSYPCEIEYFDMRGIGNYKDIALRQFDKLVKSRPKVEISVFLCIDNDAFEYSKKPPFNRDIVKKTLKEHGAKTVTYIIAAKYIEDWFLSVVEGVLNYLRLS